MLGLNLIISARAMRSTPQNITPIRDRVSTQPNLLNPLPNPLPLPDNTLTNTPLSIDQPVDLVRITPAQPVVGDERLRALHQVLVQDLHETKTAIDRILFGMPPAEIQRFYKEQFKKKLNEHVVEYIDRAIKVGYKNQEITAEKLLLLETIADKLSQTFVNGDKKARKNFLSDLEKFIKDDKEALSKSKDRARKFADIITARLEGRGADKKVIKDITKDYFGKYLKDSA